MEQACGGSPNQFLQNLYTLCFIFNFKFPILFFFGHWIFFFLILKSLILTCVPKHFLDSSGQEQKGREKEGSVNLSPDWYSNHLALVFIWYVGCPKCILYLLFVSSSEMQIPPMKTSIVDMATTLAPTSGRLLFFRAHLSPPGTSLGRIALKTIPSLCSTSVRASPSPSFSRASFSPGNPGSVILVRRSPWCVLGTIPPSSNPSSTLQACRVVSLGADSETKISGQVIYKRGDPRKHR